MVSQSGKADPSVRIVAIDEDLEFLDFLTQTLSESRVEIVTSANPEEGLDLALGVRTDIVLLDLMMPTCRGLEVLDKIVRVNPTINVILLTGEYSTESAVEAIQKGAADYLNKPISVEVLRRRVGKFVDIARERHEATQISRDLVEAFQFEGIVGWSPLMLEVFDRIRCVAPHFRNIGGALAPSPWSCAFRTLCGMQLWSNGRNLVRERGVWSRARSIHGGGPRQEGIF